MAGARCLLNASESKGTVRLMERERVRVRV